MANTSSQITTPKPDLSEFYRLTRNTNPFRLKADQPVTVADLRGLAGKVVDHWLSISGDRARFARWSAEAKAQPGYEEPDYSDLQTCFDSALDLNPFDDLSVHQLLDLIHEFQSRILLFDVCERLGITRDGDDL